MNPLNTRLLDALGLDVERILCHQARILQALRHEINLDIFIEKVCSTEDSSIIPWQTALSWADTPSAPVPTVTCIPAAGAASRFFLELREFILSMEEYLDADKHPILPCTEDFCARFPFIPTLNQHVSLQTAGELPLCAKRYSDQIANLFGPRVQPLSTTIAAYGAACALLEFYGHKPKLYIPATIEGDSFLALKVQEQQKTCPSLGTVIVVPHHFREDVRTTLESLGVQDWHILEQDQHLSTIRFLRDGRPLLTDQGQYSPVSAGHGELLRLFDNIADVFPAAQALHIRNIDNIIGTTAENQLQVSVLNNAFAKLRQELEEVRALCRSEGPRSQDAALSLYHQFAQRFFWPPLGVHDSAASIWERIKTLANRPLSVLGVVKREKGDVGGGPVFAKLSDGSVAKLCMEMPHANPHDCQEYFSDVGKVTHFNPVLVFFELRIHAHNGDKRDGTGCGGEKIHFSDLFDNRFWLLSRRDYRGTPVCYHETVLYELIGNSATTNLVFVEVPRSLFKPHKSYLDCLGRDRPFYGFEKDFKPT